MTRCSPARRAPTRLLPAHLTALAEAVDLASHALPSSSLVRVRRLDEGAPDEAELGVLDLGDVHPLVALTGFDAPADWLAVGVAGAGRVRPLDPAAPGAGGAGAGRYVLLVSRTGAWASRVHRDGGPVEHGSGLGPRRGPAGMVADVCWRALGLPTAPPPGDTGLLWSSLWLDALLAAAGRDGADAARWGWSDVCGHHAVARLLADTDRPDDVAEQLTGLGRTLARARSWSQLRRASAEGRWPVPGLEPADAAWLDDGAFARAALGSVPTLAVLRRSAAELLAAPVLERIDAVLDEWGVLAAAVSTAPDLDPW